MSWLQSSLRKSLPSDHSCSPGPSAPPSSASHLLTLSARCIAGFLVLVSSAAASYAQEAASGPITKLLSLELELFDSAIVVLAAAATIAVATREFSRGKVTVLDVPTMPKYTVSRPTYRYFNFLYAALVFILFAVVMERYEPLRQLLEAQNDIFGKFPSGDDILNISVGSVAMIVALHYLKLPNSQIGPSWLLNQLRRLLHKRARIPDEAQALAKQFLSDDAAVFSIPADQVNALATHPDVQSVTVADVGAGRNTIDYQWAIVSYLYMVGLGYKTEPPFSSFVSNDASRWPEIKKDYENLLPSILTVKNGEGGEALERATRENIANLRTNLGIFHACLHLFAINSDVERATKLKNIGLQRKAVFFVINLNLVARFLVFVVVGIAVPPLAFGGYAIWSGSTLFEHYANPILLLKWIVLGAPMYVLPFILVILLKRFMATSWSIRATRQSVLNDPSNRHKAEFKAEIYLLIFALSFGIACLPLILHNFIFQDEAPVGMYWALTPAATAASLAILIDFDVVDSGTAYISRSSRPWVLVTRALGFAVLLGGLVAWLTYTLSGLDFATLIVYATTAAFMGIMIGIRADFHNHVRVVRRPGMPPSNVAFSTHGD